MCKTFEIVYQRTNPLSGRLSEKIFGHFVGKLPQFDPQSFQTIENFTKSVFFHVNYVKLLIDFVDYNVNIVQRRLR